MAIVISGNGIDMGGNPVSNASQIDGTIVNENGINVANQTDLSKVVSAGTVIHFANSTVPSGFLECNGATISRTVYADLFAAIGTTFKIPDLRGEFIRGWDNGRGVDAGRTIGSYQADAYESHTHTGSTNSTGAHSHTVGAGTSVGSAYSYNWSGSRTGQHSTDSAGAHSHTVTINASGSTETRPRNIAFMTCIKY